jgi:site-specific DNA-cytosine methylase
MTPVEIRHFHLFCGLGGGARGFNRGEARLERLVARFRCLGGVDCSPGAVADFGRLAGVPGTVLDLFSREQYAAFHGHEPPADWREASPEDIRLAASNERPHIVFTSPPCKGFSGLLSEARSRGDKYQALNHLTLRGVWLALEAWRDDPPEFFLLENVPRIQNRGRVLLDRIVALLRAHGYTTAETTHDCGELGNLAQSRKRFLLVARHVERVPPFLYQPATRPLRGVGDVIGRLPFPGDPSAGPMHRIPALQWRTWVRLAFVEAGSDWRSLNRLAVESGVLRNYLIVPEYHRGYLGVTPWTGTSGTVTSRGAPCNGKFAVADPRVDGHAKSVQLGVRSVTDWETPLFTVTGSQQGASGALAVADPRSGLDRARGDHYLTAGHYGVTPWDVPAHAVAGRTRHDSGYGNVADPRPLPAAADRLVAIIRALDGTWHRPFTTLDLAALQGLVDPEEHLELEGLSDSAWRERIGNAVPAPAAQAIAGVMGRALLGAWNGESLRLTDEPVWVRPVAVAIAVRPA